ncbi:unnamed protein product [Dibothriocephalus latus]|uniref:MYND-type domain-containing protein n=1 Tax=Dibothriocephalus latus TaxID=60516 RepID=A0A3P7L1V8_DIBLA|nr:unnamed protein product [Dibothriocephalus latus]
MLKSGVSFKSGDIILTETTLAHALSKLASPYYCAYCVTASDNLLHCAQCKRVYYCNRQCQKAGWAFGHRGECKLIAKAGELPSATLRLLLALITTEKYKDASIFDSFVSHLEENLRDPETKSEIDRAFADLLIFSDNTLQISGSDFEVLFCKVCFAPFLCRTVRKGVKLEATRMRVYYVQNLELFSRVGFAAGVVQGCISRLGAKPGNGERTYGVLAVRVATLCLRYDSCFLVIVKRVHFWHDWVGRNMATYCVRHLSGP